MSRMKKDLIDKIISQEKCKYDEVRVYDILKIHRLQWQLGVKITEELMEQKPDTCK